jgi:hypothetical protein
MLLILALAIFVSCSLTTEKISESIKSDNNYSSSDPLLTLEVVGCTSIDKNLFEAKAGFTEFTITFENNTDKTAEIISENSLIVYGGVSYTPFITGQRHIKVKDNAINEHTVKHNNLQKYLFSRTKLLRSQSMMGDWINYRMGCQDHTVCQIRWQRKILYYPRKANR